MLTRKKYIVAIAILVSLLSYFTYDTMQGAAVYYLTVSEALDQSSDQETLIRVNGKLVLASFSRQENQLESHFKVTDDIATMEAQFDGVLPDLFFNENSELVLEGAFDSDGIFRVQNVLVKCPSKYVAEELDTLA